MRYRLGRQVDRLPPRLVEGLTPAESSRFGQYLARFGDDGRIAVADGSGDFRDLIVRSDGLDEDTTRALLRAHARGDLDDAALQRTARYLDEGRMDQADVWRMEEILETRNSDPMLDDDLGANDLLDIVDQNGDLSDARMIVQRRGSTPGLDSDIVWLEEGTAGVNGDAWRKIVEKHGDQLIGKYDNIDTEADIERMIRNGVENPDRVITTSDGKARFIYTVDEGDTPVSIFVGSNGYIQSAYTRSE